MSSYMRGYSKRKPYLFIGLKREDRMMFFSSPVRHLLESLERESALEKPYLDYGPPQRKHMLPGGGQVRRFESISSYPITDMWKVLYNRPECVLDIRNLDCDEEPDARIDIEYGAGWQYGDQILFWVQCSRDDLIWFSDKLYTATQSTDSGDTITLVSDAQGVMSSTYWSGATLEGRWKQEFTTPLKMTCIGGVVYKGGWAKEETKFGTSMVTQSVTATATSGSPGQIAISGGNLVGSWERGSNVHTLRDLGLDPNTVSLDGHNAVTSAAQLAAARGGIASSSFNNIISGRAINELTATQHRERLDWFSTPGRIDSWYSGFLQCPAIEVDVSCKGEKCEDDETFRYSISTSANSVTAGNDVTIGVAGGTPPFYWSVDGTGFSFANRTTTTRTNTLTAGVSACGPAKIKVIEACGKSTFGVCRELGGAVPNTTWTVEDTCGPYDDDAWYAFGVTKDGYIAVDDWCEGDCGANCQDTCTSVVPNSIKIFPSGTTPCRVESTRIWSWVCN